MSGVQFYAIGKKFRSRFLHHRNLLVNSRFSCRIDMVLWIPITNLCTSCSCCAYWLGL